MSYFQEYAARYANNAPKSLETDSPSQAFYRAFRWIILAALVLALLSAAQLGHAQQATDTYFDQDPNLVASPPVKRLNGGVEFNAHAYRLGPGDVLSVNVYHQTDLNQANILVRADGMASFNAVGELDVQDKTLFQVQKMIETALLDLVKDPIVTVTVAQTKPGIVYLAGAVKHPGMYQLNTGNQNSVTGPSTSQPITRIDMRLSNVLANSGGVKMNADLSQVEIKRNLPTGPVSITVNLWKMLKDGDGSQDVMLQSGDSVNIPALPAMAMNDEDYGLVLNSAIGPETFPVRVIGALEKPGIYSLEGNSPYLNSAIALAGGYKDEANKNVIAIRRFTSENDFSTIYVDGNKLDVVLRPNDIIFVGEKKIHQAGKFFNQVSQIMKPFTDAAFSFGVLGGLF